MPAPAKTDYATVDEMAAMLSIARGNDRPTATLQRYLNAAASMLDQKTRKPIEGYVAFSASNSEARNYDDVLAEAGYVPIDDAITITAVTRDGTAIASTAYKLYPYNRGNGPVTALYFLWDAAFPTSVFTGGGAYNFPFKGVGVGTIAVTGTWGYCTKANRPWEIKEATLMQALAMYRKIHMPSDKVAQALRDPFKHMTAEVEALISRFVKDDGVGFS